MHPPQHDANMLRGVLEHGHSMIPGKALNLGDGLDAFIDAVPVFAKKSAMRRHRAPWAVDAQGPSSLTHSDAR
jgi:hypothetical protein